ncbi:hypothetical protein C8R46DRAFT_1225689 [Mycena filopes]|nr:hypothetical protein C8R46DRAFT_1225689 [Mycena filopes]
MNTIARLGLTPTRSRVSAPPTTIFISATRHLHTLPRVQFESHIPASRALGVAYAAQIAQEELCVYTDGSAFGGGVGGAARARTPAGTLVMKEHLGPQRQDSQDGHGHIAVEGEILGIILGLGIIKAFPGVHNLRATARQRAVQVRVFDRFHAEARDMGPGLRRLRLAWVPAHEGVQMNELVDGDARAAAAGESGTMLITGGVQLSLSPSLKFL